MGQQGEHGITWTDETWNPTRGCSRVSEGCRNCYAERFAVRVPGYGPFVKLTSVGPLWTGKVELIPERLTAPLHWKKPRRVFVNSMSDLFHEALPDEAIDKVFAVMALCPQHTFQVLTKRPERMRKWFAHGKQPGWTHREGWVLNEIKQRQPNRLTIQWPLANIWLGVSVEDQATADERIPLLLQTPAAVRFVSYEPALGPVDFTRFLIPIYTVSGRRGKSQETAIALHQLARAAALENGIPLLDWIIVGGESGPHARPAHPEWLRAVRDQCQVAGVPFFFKQWGEWWHDDTQPVPDDLRRLPVIEKDGANMYRVGKQAAGALLDGREWREFPEVRG
jgi:protein gp37